jgi:hypothetical protein
MQSKLRIQKRTFHLNQLTTLGFMLATLALGVTACGETEEFEDPVFAEQDEQSEPPADLGDELVITQNGVSRPDLILAQVEPDDETELYFVANEQDDGHVAIDVIIVGRDGGVNYGDLLGPERATPLELYLAVAGQDVEPPAAFVEAHLREIEQTGREEGAELVVPQIADPQDPQASHGPSDSHKQTYGNSTFTCLSWNNFQTFMNSIHTGWAGRAQTLSAPTTGYNDLYLPNPWDWYATGSADMVVCNYKSNDPSVEDEIWAHACHYYNLGNPQSSCGTQILYDGQYLRRVYGFQYSYRRYKVDSAPLNGEILQSFLGIMRSNG